MILLDTNVVSELMRPAPESKVLDDKLTAAKYATIVATRTHRGRPISVENAQIAAIARSVGLTLAARNTKDFSDIDELQLMNPWM